MKHLRESLVAFLIVLLVGVLLLLASCVAPLTRQPLMDQEIRVRKQGFTNQLCSKPKIDGSCEQMDVVVYDLADAATRARLIEVKMICNVAGKRFRIFSDAPCLYATETIVTRRVLGIPVKRELVVKDKICMPEGHQELMDKQTFCAPFGSASERGMKWN